MKVFLGGTCNGSTWKDDLISMLKCDYFNPVVDEWNDAAQQRELEERENADYVLYAITPKMTGFCAIAEVVDDSNKRPEKTWLVVLDEDGSDVFDKHQLKSMKAVEALVVRNGGNVSDSLKEAAGFFNILMNS